MNSMKPEIVWLSVFVALGIYEIYAMFTGQETLSKAVWDGTHSEYGATIPFVVGYLCGHFFFSGK